MIQRVGLEWLFRSFYDKRKALNITRYSLIFLKDFLVYKK
jgi:UDP-N-acetyl-D-mannosaminuronic acid transferase (WecB/TagA/CpsF family)